jgi:integrase
MNTWMRRLKGLNSPAIIKVEDTMASCGRSSRPVSCWKTALEALYTLAIHTGMRQGEMLALRWQDVDVENAVVSVRRTLTRRGGKVAFGEPKTNKSHRYIRLSSQAVEALRSHLNCQLREIEILPRTWANKPSRAMRQGSVCGMLGGASRFLYPPRMKSWLQFAACGVSQI